MPAAGALGRVGIPAGVNTALLRHLLDGGYLPVISPVARDIANADGAPLNVNGDDAAAAIAAAMSAAELLFVSRRAGCVARRRVRGAARHGRSAACAHRRRERRHGGEARSGARAPRRAWPACGSATSRRLEDAACGTTVTSSRAASVSALPVHGPVRPPRALPGRGAAPRGLQAPAGGGVRARRGGGALSTPRGRRYLDFTSGIAVNALGYGDAGIAAAMRDAIATASFTSSNLFHTAPGGRSRMRSWRVPSRTASSSAIPARKRTRARSSSRGAGPARRTARRSTRSSRSAAVSTGGCSRRSRRRTGRNTARRSAARGRHLDRRARSRRARAPARRRRPWQR